MRAVDFPEVIALRSQLLPAADSVHPIGSSVTDLACWTRCQQTGSCWLSPRAFAAWQLVLPPSACFTSLTAAELRGWWCPWRAPHPMFVSVPCDAPHPQRRGLFVTRHRRSIASEMINGIRLASAAEALLAAASDLGLLDRDLPALLWLGFERRSDGSRSDDVEGDRRAFGRWGTRAGSGVDNEVDSRAVNANPLHLGLEAGFAHHLPSRG